MSLTPRGDKRRPVRSDYGSDEAGDADDYAAADDEYSHGLSWFLDHMDPQGGTPLDVDASDADHDADGTNEPEGPFTVILQSAKPKDKRQSEGSDMPRKPYSRGWSGKSGK